MIILSLLNFLNLSLLGVNQMNIKFIKHLAKTGKSPYFFSKKTMEFFNSKVYPDVAATEKGYQFITSESFGENHLRFSLRHIDFEGRIETLFTRKSYEKIKMLMIS